MTETSVEESGVVADSTDELTIVDVIGDVSVIELAAETTDGKGAVPIIESAVCVVGPTSTSDGLIIETGGESTTQVTRIIKLVQARNCNRSLTIASL